MLFHFPSRFRVDIALYLNEVAAKELSKPFYTGCVWSNFRFRGEKNMYVTEFEHEIPVRWILSLRNREARTTTTSFVPSLDRAFRFLARNEKLGQSWSPTINNLCRIGEFHQPRFFTRRGFDVTFYRGHQFCLIGRLSKKLFARAKNTYIPYGISRWKAKFWGIKIEERPPFSCEIELNRILLKKRKRKQNYIKPNFDQNS